MLAMESTTLFQNLSQEKSQPKRIANEQKKNKNKKDIVCMFLRVIGRNEGARLLFITILRQKAVKFTTSQTYKQIQG